MIDETSKDKPAPERFDEKSIEPRDDVHVHGAGGLRCPFCHDDVDIDAAAAWVACERCLARHHEACWAEAGRCGGCAHDVALAGRLRPRPEERPRSLTALWVLLAVGLLSVATIVVVGMVTYARMRGRSSFAAQQAEQAARAARAEQAARRLQELHDEELRVRMTEGPRRVDVADGYAVIDAKGDWIFVDVVSSGMRAGIGATFLDAEGGAAVCAPSGQRTYALEKSEVPPGVVMIIDAEGVMHELRVTPGQRDAIVTALQAPPGEVDVAALLKEHGYVEREQR